MKYYVIRIIFLISLILISKVYSYAQMPNDSVSIRLTLESKEVLFKGKKEKALGFYALIENKSDKDIFLVDKLLEFDRQGLDTLSIFSMEDGVSKLFKVQNAIKRSQVIGSDIINPLLNEYLINHTQNKKDSEKILLAYKNAGNQLSNSFNPLFLKAKQKVILYFIPNNGLFITPGNYKATFTTQSRKLSGNLPNTIFNYHMVALDRKELSLNYSVRQSKDKRFIITVARSGSTNEKNITFDKTTLVPEFP